MAISNTPKPAYIYKDGTWYPISAPVNTAANYDWTGEHVFKNAVTFEEVLKAEGGVNNFQNPAERDTYIQTPANGTVVFIRQDALGNTINQVQYYQSGSWINHNNIRIDEKTASYTIGTHDVDKLIKVNSSSNLEVIIPNDSTTNFAIGSRIEVGRYGTGEVTVTTPAGSGVTIRAVSNSYSIPNQFGAATITKIAANEWWLVVFGATSSVTPPPPTFTAPPSFTEPPSFSAPPPPTFTAPPSFTEPPSFSAPPPTFIVPPTFTATTWYCRYLENTGETSTRTLTQESDPSYCTAGVAAEYCLTTSTPTVQQVNEYCNVVATPPSFSAPPPTFTAPPSFTEPPSFSSPSFAAPPTFTAPPSFSAPPPSFSAGCTTPEPYPGECFCDNGTWLC